MEKRQSKIPKQEDLSGVAIHDPGHIEVSRTTGILLLLLILALIGMATVSQAAGSRF